MLERGRAVFYVFVFGLVGVVLVTLRRLPPSVASHFDAAGTPNRWSSRRGYALLLVVTGVLLPLSVALAPALGAGFLACGRVLRMGRTLTVCQADVFTTGASERALIATMLSTIILRPRRSGGSTQVTGA